MEIAATNQNFINPQAFDRLGITASILCAIHCALTPVLLILLPTFGKAWAHPSTHWGMAIIVVPIAVIMMRKGYRKRANKKILYIGTSGVILIIIGAFLPYLEASPISTQTNTQQSSNETTTPSIESQSPI